VTKNTGIFQGIRQMPLSEVHFSGSTFCIPCVTVASRAARHAIPNVNPIMGEEQ
jgi:hypothetical protein